MALAPIDYSRLTAQLDLSPILDGIRVRQQSQAVAADQTRADTDGRRVDAAIAQQGAEDARKRTFFDAFGKVMANPNAAGFKYLRGSFPEYLKTTDDAAKTYQDERNVPLRATAGGIVTSLMAGKPDLALSAIDKNLPSLSDEDGSLDTVNTIRTLVASGRPEQLKAAQRLGTLVLAQASGDRFNEVYSSLGREDRETELQPDKLRKADADADYSETRAQYAPTVQAATIAGKQARNANTQSIIDRRNRIPIPQPRARSGGGGGATGGGSDLPKIRKGEPVSYDAKGTPWVARGGKWVQGRK